MIDPETVEDLDLSARRAVCAYHEAGHAAAYLQSGRRFRYATIRPRRTGEEGAVRVRPARIDPLLRLRLLYAGPAAEAMYLSEGDCDPEDLMGDVLVLGGSAGDWWEIEQIEESHGLYTGQANEVEAEAIRLVKDNWPLVTTIAEELIERGTASYSRLAALLPDIHTR